MSFYEGDQSANITLATQNPYDGGITAHEVAGTDNGADASYFDDFGANSIFEGDADGSSDSEPGWQEAAAGIGASEITVAPKAQVTQAAAGYDNAGQNRAYSGMSQVAAGYDNAGQNRAYSGSALALANHDRAGQAMAPRALPQAAPRVSARMYSGLGSTPSFNPDEVWADILRSSERDARGAVTVAAQQAGARWASAVKAALALVGYPSVDVSPMWTNDDASRYSTWAASSGLKPTSWGIPAKEHIVVLARQIVQLPSGSRESTQTMSTTNQSSMTERSTDNKGSDQGSSNKAIYWTVGLLSLAGVAAFAYFKTKKSGAKPVEVALENPSPKGRKSRKFARASKSRKSRAR